jgi:hypothetical protein
MCRFVNIGNFCVTFFHKNTQDEEKKKTKGYILYINLHIYTVQKIASLQIFNYFRLLGSERNPLMHPITYFNPAALR